MEWDPRAAVCVVLAAEGYPGAVEKGRPIDGLERLRDWRDVMVFHAGTRLEADRVVTDGGRVLGVTALGATVEDAVAEAYAASPRSAGRACTTVATSDTGPWRRASSRGPEGPASR